MKTEGKTIIQSIQLVQQLLNHPKTSLQKIGFRLKVKQPK